MRSVEPQDVLRVYQPKSMVVPVGMMLKGYNQLLKRGNGQSPSMKVDVPLKPLEIEVISMDFSS